MCFCSAPKPPAGGTRFPPPVPAGEGKPASRNQNRGGGYRAGGTRFVACFRAHAPAPAGFGAGRLPPPDIPDRKPPLPRFSESRRSVSRRSFRQEFHFMPPRRPLENQNVITSRRNVNPTPPPENPGTPPAAGVGGRRPRASECRFPDEGVSGPHSAGPRRKPFFFAVFDLTGGLFIMQGFCQSKKPDRERTEDGYEAAHKGRSGKILRGRVHPRGAAGAGTHGRLQRGAESAHGKADAPKKEAFRVRGEDLVSRCRLAHPAHRHKGPGREGRKVRGRGDSPRPAKTVDTGNRSRGQARLPRGKEHKKRGLRASFGSRRVDVRRRGRPGADSVHVARQPAQPQAGHRQGPGVHEDRRGRGGRDEQVGQRLFRKGHNRGLGKAARLHHGHIPRAGTSPGRPPRAGRKRRRSFGVGRGHDPVRGEQPRGTREKGLLPGSLPAQDTDGRRGRAVERDDERPRVPPRHRGRNDKGVRARGAARGDLPAHGDQGGSRQALRRVQTPAGGTT